MATSIIELARAQGRREGRTQERERIIEWLGAVRKEVKKEPAIATAEELFTEDHRAGAVEIINVLVEKLKGLE